MIWQKAKTEFFYKKETIRWLKIVKNYQLKKWNHAVKKKIENSQCHSHCCCAYSAFRQLKETSVDRSMDRLCHFEKKDKNRNRSGPSRCEEAMMIVKTNFYSETIIIYSINNYCLEQTKKPPDTKDILFDKKVRPNHLIVQCYLCLR